MSSLPPRCSLPALVRSLRTHHLPPPHHPTPSADSPFFLRPRTQEPAGVIVVAALLAALLAAAETQDMADR